VPGRLARVEIVVIAISADGTISRAVVDTAGRVDADWWERLAALAHLEVPPPYRPEPGRAIYEIRARGHVVQVSEGEITGPLRELVIAVLAEGWAVQRDLAEPASRISRTSGASRAGTAWSALPPSGLAGPNGRVSPRTSVGSERARR
jgi:hypothetical protein